MHNSIKKKPEGFCYEKGGSNSVIMQITKTNIPRLGIRIRKKWAKTQKLGDLENADRWEKAERFVTLANTDESPDALTQG
jgi:hypothetical protein